MICRDHNTHGERMTSGMVEGGGRRILPLSAEAVAQIHSSKHITSLQGVILALLENSLDASANKVSITVDWRRGSCTIDDNGSGIPASDFVENGGLGRMYCTSKRAPVGIGPKDANEMHGLTGTFLAELGAMSLLSITSTHQSTQQTASMTIHQGKVIARRVEDVHNTTTFESAGTFGTIVDVRDLFGNMPVRVKQRALSTGSAGDEGRSWHELKFGIVGLLLPWPRPCAVKVSDINDETRVLNITGQHPSISAALTSKSLNHLAGNSTRYDLRDALPVLFQSGFAPVESKHRWVPLSASTSAITLKGLVCLDPAPSKHCQFLAIGIRPCTSISGPNELNESINKIFANSSFGGIEDDAHNSGIETSKARFRDGQHQSRQVQARKGIDRFPMYCIQLRMEDRIEKDAYPNTVSDASLKKLIDVLEAAVYAWLERNHFRPKKRRRRKRAEQISRNPSTPSRPASAGTLDTRDMSRSMSELGMRVEEAASEPPKRRKVLDLTHDPASSGRIDAFPATAFDGISRIRTGQMMTGTREQHRPMLAEAGEGFARNEQLFEGHETDMPFTANSTNASLANPASDGGQIFSEDFGSFDDAEMIAAVDGVIQATGGSVDGAPTDEDSVLKWTDPASKQVYRVNSRTGVVLPFHSGPDRSDLEQRRRAGIDTTLSSAGKPISLARRRALARDDTVLPLNTVDKQRPTILQSWSNPVFVRQDEEPIPVASVNGPGPLEVSEQSKCCAPNFHSPCHASHDIDAGTKLSKTALKQALVIQQVDTKFILCQMPSTLSEREGSVKNQRAARVLVLVDQHAASERIILEHLLASLCVQHDETAYLTVRTAALATQTARAKPLVFEISDREHELFTQYRQHFTTWGILFDLVSKDPTSTQTAGTSKPELRLVVRSLPAAIAERCANFPALCIEMLRTELWELADGAKRPMTSLPAASVDEGSPSWLVILPLLPSGLRDMLHSRSCRSAIMFNDALTRADCEKLLDDLSQCVFPFICAHGRTSMVPLAELDSEDKSGAALGVLNIADGHDSDSNKDREQPCQVDALAKWMEKR